MNIKRSISIIAVVIILIISQFLMVKLVYSHKIQGSTAEFLASIYKLKAGTIEDNQGNIDISLEDFFNNKKFANKLLAAQVATDPQFADLEISDQEMSDIVWDKLLKQAWLNKIATENNIEVSKEDVDYYIDSMGGQEKLEELIKNQGVSVDEYKHFLVEADILEYKVLNYLLSNFADERGVSRIQEAYSFLESENGKNWDEAVEKYGEDAKLSDNSFWLAEDELVDVYEAIKEVEEGGFSKIVQTPLGYIIWHVDNIASDEDTNMTEVRGLFVYAKGVGEFLDDYLNKVSVKRKY